jgi:hypothetical protein
LHEIVQLTLRAIEDRARVYRNTVVAVSLVVLAAPVLALVLWSARPLAAWLISIPITIVFLWYDRWIVDRWRRQVMTQCASRGLDLAVVLQILPSQRHLPENTLAGMLEELRAFKARR